MHKHSIRTTQWGRSRRDLGHADSADGIRDDLFGFVTLSRHGSDPPRCHKTDVKMDQFIGVDHIPATERRHSDAEPEDEGDALAGELCRPVPDLACHRKTSVGSASVIQGT